MSVFSHLLKFNQREKGIHCWLLLGKIEEEEEVEEVEVEEGVFTILRKSL